MKQLLTGFEAAVAVRLLRDSHPDTILIVEGPNDERFYSRHVVEKCHFVIAHGKDNLERSLRSLDAEGFAGVLGIKDADFGWYEGLAPWSSNLIWTDHHDLDVLLLSSAACASVIAELVDKRKLQEFRVRTGVDLANSILSAVSVLGFLRLHSLRIPLNLRFEGIAFENFVDMDTLTINQNRMITEVRNKSNRHDLDFSELLQAIEALMVEPHDPRQVSCGPDALEFLSLALRKGLAANERQEVKRELLQRYLRLAYRSEDFEETQLHSVMTEWSDRNPDYPLLPSRN